MWATSADSQRRIPIDPLPHEAGNVEVLARGDGSLVASVLKHDGQRTSDRPLYRAHWATCPHAERHRAARLTPVPDEGPRCTICRLPIIPVDGVMTHPCCEPEHQAYLEGAI